MESRVRRDFRFKVLNDRSVEGCIDRSVMDTTPIPGKYKRAALLRERVYLSLHLGGVYFHEIE